MRRLNTYGTIRKIENKKQEHLTDQEKKVLSQIIACSLNCFYIN